MYSGSQEPVFKIVHCPGHKKGVFLYIYYFDMSNFAPVLKFSRSFFNIYKNYHCLTLSDQSWPSLTFLTIPDHGWLRLTYSDHTWPPLTSPDLLWPALTLPNFSWNCWPYLTFSDHTWTFMAMPDLVWPCLTTPDLAWPFLTLPTSCDHFWSPLNFPDLDWSCMTLSDLTWIHDHLTMHAGLEIRSSVFQTNHLFFVIERAKDRFDHEKKQITPVALF